MIYNNFLEKAKLQSAKGAIIRANKVLSGQNIFFEGFFPDEGLMTECVLIAFTDTVYDISRPSGLVFKRSFISQWNRFSL